MGNRALRKRVGDAMRAAGFPRRYSYGSTKGMRNKYCNARYLRELLYMLSLKPGTLVNDCDAFNHRVKKPLGYFYHWDRGFHKFVLDQLEFDDGRWSCGCPGGPGSALTREQIEKYLLLTDEEIEDSKKRGWWNDRSQAMQDTLRSGGHVCDKDGMKLPGFETDHDEKV